MISVKFPLFESKEYNYFLPGLSCPEIDVDYNQNDAGFELNIESWEACAQECAPKASCFAWSWSKTLKKCHFKNKMWINDRRDFKGVISGKKTCLPKKAEGTRSFNYQIHCTLGHSVYVNQGAFLLVFAQIYLRLDERPAQ